MIFNVERFSPELCLVQATLQRTTDIPEECFEINEKMPGVSVVIMELYDTFEDEFESMLRVPIKTFKYSAYLYVKGLLSKLIKISVSPYYFYFILSCSLVYTAVFSTFPVMKCFTLAKLTSLALIMVYNRCYIDLFRENEEYGSLSFYCRNILSVFRSGYEFIPGIDIEEIYSLLQSLIDFDYSDFSLTNSEETLIRDTLDAVPIEAISSNAGISPNMSCDFSLTNSEETLIRDTLDAVPIEEISLNAEISPNMSCESPSSSNDSMSDESNDSVSSDDHRSLVGRICKHCGRKCFNFLLLHVKEVHEMKNLSTLIRG